jgi:hypothetical protein
MSKLRRNLYRAAKLMGDAEAAEKGHGAFARRQARKRVYREESKLTRRFLRKFGTPGSRCRRCRAWFDGRAAVRRFFVERVFETPWRLVPVTANGQLAIACYMGDAAGNGFSLSAINVLTLRGREIFAPTASSTPKRRGRSGRRSRPTPENSVRRPMSQSAGLGEG